MNHPSVRMVCVSSIASGMLVGMNLPKSFIGKSSALMLIAGIVIGALNLFFSWRRRY